MEITYFSNRRWLKLLGLTQSALLAFGSLSTGSRSAVLFYFMFSVFALVERKN
jgi:hypothetical protein